MGLVVTGAVTLAIGTGVAATTGFGRVTISDGAAWGGVTTGFG